MPVSSIAELKTVIGNLIRTVSGVNAVIEANQNQAPPEGPYGTYNLTPIRAYGHPRKSRTDIPSEEEGPTPGWEDFAESTVTQLLLNVSINFFEAGSADAINRLHNAQFRQPVREILYKNGIAWRSTSESRELTERFEGQLQARFQADAQLFVETEVTDTVLKAAGFSIQVLDENGNIIATGGS